MRLTQGTMPSTMPSFDPTRPRPKRSGLAQQAGASITQVDPTNDLRSKQVLPGQDPRLQATQTQTDKAQGSLASFSGYTPFQGVAAQDGSRAGVLNQQATSALGSGYVPASNPAAARGYMTGAAGAASGGNVSYGGPSAIQYGADTTGLRSQYANQTQGLQNAPDRSSLAAQAFQLMQEQQAPQREQAFRQVNQRAAAMGRQGAGMTTNDLTGLEQDYIRQDNLSKRDLALQAAGETLNDRLNINSALRGATEGLAGLDTSQAGFQADAATRRMSADEGNRSAGFQRAGILRGLGQDEMSLAEMARREGESDRSYGLQRGGFLSDQGAREFDQAGRIRDEARGERSDRLNYDQADLDARRGVFRDLGDRESTLFDQGQRSRDEIRGERSWQGDQAQQGIDNAVRQTTLEEMLLGNQFGRDQDELAQTYDLGYGYDPSGTYGDVADVYSGEAADAFGGVGDLLGGMAQERATRGASGGAGYVPPTVQMPSFAPQTFGRAGVPRQTALDRYRFGGA